jgi:hypothetical protein
MVSEIKPYEKQRLTKESLPVVEVFKRDVIKDDELFVLIQLLKVPDT